MNRRGFLGAMLGAAVAAVARIYPTPALPVAPRKTIAEHAAGLAPGEREACGELEQLDEARSILEIMTRTNQMLADLPMTPGNSPCIYVSKSTYEKVLRAVNSKDWPA